MGGMEADVVYLEQLFLFSRYLSIKTIYFSCVWQF